MMQALREICRTMTNMKFLSNTVEQTQSLGAQFAQYVQPGDVVLLIGDLGAGKTHFTQGLAKGLEIEQVPTSPTFNIMCVYEGGRMPLYHFDLYRLEDPEELEDIDYFGVIESDGVSLVEWGDRFEDAQPDECLILDFTVLPTQERIIAAQPVGARGQKLAEAFMRAQESVQGNGEGLAHE